MKNNNLYVFYVKNANTGKPRIVETFTSYKEAEKYWIKTTLKLGIYDIWGVHFQFEENKESDDLDITKEVIFGKAQVELR